MILKDALADARRGLSAGLKGWVAPKGQLLPVDPALAASCLKTALRYRKQDLADAAAATLSVFAPHLVWNELLASATAETAMFDLGPTLAVMAAKRDKAWLRRKGGTKVVTSYLIDQLMQAPCSMDAIHLWRLSFDDPETSPVPLRAMAAEAQYTRRNMMSTFGAEPYRSEWAEKPHHLTRRSSENMFISDVCTAAFRQVMICPALMQPILHRCQYASVQRGAEGNNGSRTTRKTTCGDDPSWLVAALTQNTPAGRNAIREVVRSTPDLADACERLELSEYDSIAAVGDLLDRRCEDQLIWDAGQTSVLRQASRWSGVEMLDKESAMV
jgi:hypothetical protein